jgi:hypothetical protein
VAGQEASPGGQARPATSQRPCVGAPEHRPVGDEPASISMHSVRLQSED